MNALQTTINEHRKYLNSIFINRHDAIDVGLWTWEAKMNAFFLGPPGTAKSLLGDALCQIFSPASYFSIQFYPFTTPEDVFGPVSMKGLANDIYVRNTDGYLPKAHAVLADEFWRIGPGIADGLLMPINERKYKNGATLENMPLVSFIATANSVPEENGDMAALWDRLTIRCEVQYIDGLDDFQKLVGRKRGLVPTRPSPIPLSELDTIHKEVRGMPVEEDTWNAIEEIRHKLTAAGINLSDRKWMQLCGATDIFGNQTMSLMKAAAWMNGHDAVKPTDLYMLYYSAWNWPKEQRTVYRIVSDLVNPLDSQAQDILNKAQAVYGKLSTIKEAEADYIKKLADLNKELQPIDRECRAHLQGRDLADPAVRLMVNAATAISKMRQVIADKLSM